MCLQSQDDHTPRVIASIFLELDAWRIRPPFICTAPAQACMDEVDGRPGHVALQSGHLDAPMDVPNLSLCRPHLALSFTVILRHFTDAVILSEDRTNQIVILSEGRRSGLSRRTCIFPFSIPAQLYNLEGVTP